MCDHVWEPEVDVGCLPLLPYSAVTEVGSLDEPRARQFGQFS